MVQDPPADGLMLEQYRAYLRTRMAEQVAEQSVTQAEVEQGRQALLQGDNAEAPDKKVPGHAMDSQSSRPLAIG